MPDIGNHDDESQQSGSQQEAEGPTSGSQRSASQVNSQMGQNSTGPGTNGDEPSEPVRFNPPEPLARPKRRNVWSIHLALGFLEYRNTIEEDVQFCARSPKSRKSTNEWGHRGVGTGVILGVSQSREHAVRMNVQCRYVVVGIIGKEESVPHEEIFPMPLQEDLFKQIRVAEGRLRNPLRRFLSLKRVGAFGLYRCHPSQDYHSSPDISDETKRCLVELYRNYRTEERDHQDRWKTWIHANFNNGSTNSEDGTYALQLLLQWSPVKLIIWSSIPILLSLAIGLWYMINPYPGEDHVAVVQTAWTIASYIVTTAALALAIMAIITQFGDV